jgi:hypothetical protein
LPQIKRDRKIFFFVDWLNAFIDGQQWPAAQAEVHEYLRTASLAPDLWLKILPAVAELDRTVKIQRKSLISGRCARTYLGRRDGSGRRLAPSDAR